MTQSAQASAAQLIRSDELWEGEHRVIRVGQLPVIVLRVRGEVVAFVDRCAHLGASLQDAHFAEEVLECSKHGWRYSALTGRGLNPAHVSLTKVPVEERDGWIAVGGLGG
ncbi:MAG: Rieske (2Fe-2S) protein [Deltaproteobacteria bacterium]|nr:Rieske (2Fe-2S) protein [Deltaproteobacteria bacterium]